QRAQSQRELLDLAIVRLQKLLESSRWWIAHDLTNFEINCLSRASDADVVRYGHHEFISATREIRQRNLLRERNSIRIRRAIFDRSRWCGCDQLTIVPNF